MKSVIEYRQTIEDRYVVNRDNSGMPELCRRPGFTEEPRHFLTAFDQMRMRDLQCNGSVEPEVKCTPDRSKSADANPLQQLEGAEPSGLAVVARNIMSGQRFSRTQPCRYSPGCGPAPAPLPGQE